MPTATATTTTHPEFSSSTTGSDVAAAFPNAINGRTILITGVNKLGIGYSTAEAFASQSPKTIVLAGRNEAKVNECADGLREKYPAVQYKTLILNLSSQTAVRRSAQQLLSWTDVPVIDILINNAGVMMIPTQDLSHDGIEMHFAVNHVGHFLFTNLIMSKIIAASHPEGVRKGATRTINVSSHGTWASPMRWSDVNQDKVAAELPESERPNWGSLAETGLTGVEDVAYIPPVAYGQSKTANLLFGLALNARLYEKFGILSVGLHPGGINTELMRWMDPKVLEVAIQGWKDAGRSFKGLEQGASTSLVAALDPGLALPERSSDEGKDGKGAYLNDCQISEDVPGWATSWSEAERLWGLSEGLVGEKFQY